MELKAGDWVTVLKDVSPYLVGKTGRVLAVLRKRGKAVVRVGGTGGSSGFKLTYNLTSIQKIKGDFSYRYGLTDL